MAARQSAGGQYFPISTENVFDDKSDVKLFDTEINDASISSLKKILQINAQTSEEKFKVLDARDKLYKIMKDKDASLSRGALVATCPDMCPEKERLLREYQGRGSIFEMTNYSKTSSFSHNLAVKEYARSSADQEEPLPHDLRPVHVLTMTMSYLLHNVVDFCELSDDNLEEWYMFMWDRTRALRKELTQQGVCSLESVTLVEQCARFHIHCAERLVDQDSSIYDDKINTENLTKCLQTLKYMYKDLAKEDIKCPNEPEFICYTLLLNLNNSSVFTELSDQPNSLMNSEPVKFALNVMTTWETRNYIRFFNLVKQTTYLNCCLLIRYFGEMRLYAVKIMMRSYCTKTYSPQILISRFVEMLNFEGEKECIEFLSLCNFNFHEVDGRTVVNFDRVLFRNPKAAPTPRRAYLFIEEKKQKPLSVVMAGGGLPLRLFEEYIPQNSFTPNGDLDLELSPQKELLEYFSISSQPRGFFDTKVESFKPSMFDFQKGEQQESISHQKLQKRQEEPPGSSQTPLFSIKENNPPSTNSLGSFQPSSFGVLPGGSNIFGSKFPIPSANTTGSLFDFSNKSRAPKNSLDSPPSSALFGSNRQSIFSSNVKPFPGFGITSTSSNQEVKEQQTSASPPLFPIGGSIFVSNLQPKPDEDQKLKEEREQRERLERERLEKEIILREKVEQEKRKRKEEEIARILEEERLQEENQRKEMERREREKREEEERKRERLVKREIEEKLRQEEKARQERLREENARRLAELKKEEERKRVIELEHKRRMEKMSELKQKMQKWKTKIVFDRWRMKTWSIIEGRKMEKYFKEVKLKYPPVCSEELLNGNPYGLLIPSMLTFEKFREWGKETQQETAKKLLIVNDHLPLLKLPSILGKSLEDRAKSLGVSLDSFPWKLIISVPDALESPQYWKSVETFVEMHFVEYFEWKFGIQNGPLYCREGCRGTFRFHISVRRLRGCKLHEGSDPNPSATTGSNALIFFITETGSEMTKQRLRAVLRSRAPLPKIPVVAIVLGGQSNQNDVRKLLELETLEKSHVSECHVVSMLDGGRQLVEKLTRCLILSAGISAAPSSLRISRLSDFFSGTWLDCLWRRVEISLSNYKVTLQEPKVLIEFFNSCLGELAEIFFDRNYDQRTVLGQEFSGFTESNPPKRTAKYEEKLRSLLERLRLPHWPAETPKSCHQLNYRIHQYCKKVAGSEKANVKNLKWLLSRIIRKSLLWKGLDIYCDEDISEILINFPWIQVFQEISRVMIRQLTKEIKGKEDVIIVYDTERIDKFTFEQSLIGKFLVKSRRQKKGFQLGEDEEVDDLNPCLEKDSIVYAYAAAIERETGKRKREECFEESLDALFSSPAGKRVELDEEPPTFDYSGMEANFQRLDDRLSEMKKRMNENLQILLDLQNQM